MPLRGGPSDKIGNRYELRWIVRQLVDLVTGRITWLRIEPPGDDAIEFRCRSRHGEVAYQVKRGVSGGGHWTIAALADVLDGFGALLGAEPTLRCVFGSSHAAPALEELADRARASRDTDEFNKRFLNAGWLAKAWKALRTRWATDEHEAWSRLRRISVAAIGERDLQEHSESILQLLFDAQPETTRAVLTDFALESVHRELNADDVVRRLASRSIRPKATTSAASIAPSLLPPPATGIRREAELALIASLIGHGKATVVTAGISGIGKTTVASQYAAKWGKPVCWLDGALLSSAAEAIATLGEFLAGTFQDSSVTRAASGAEEQVVGVGRLAGKVLAANKCLVVWDGVDGDRQDQLRPVIDAVATTISGGGAQLVTTQETWDSGNSTIASVHIDRFDKPTVRRLVTDAFPDARAADVDAANELTHGHPYMVQLLIDAAHVVDLGSALRSMQSEARADSLASTMLGHLPTSLRKLLASLTWLEIPFGPTLVSRLGGNATDLKDLAARHLIVRSGGEKYRVHELVAHLIKTAATDRERAECHERSALLLRNIANPSWLEVQATLRHAQAASMSNLTREAGTFLLRYAADRGLWWLAREAAENLTRDSPDFYPHFVLGKCYRMSREPDKALVHYEIAEANAPSSNEREIARYDRASVLCELGRRSEADPLYRGMLNSTEPTTRAAARIALALGMSERGERDTALRMLKAALRIATSSSGPRILSEVHHAIARVLIDGDQWRRARHHVRKAQAVRHKVEGPEAFDALGWFHLCQCALQIERALGNRAAARSAARGLWRFAIVSGSVPWETTAASAFCLTSPTDDDSDVLVALARLRGMSADASQLVSLRVSALESLIICEWSLKHHEAAVEAILELLAIANEHNVDVPVFGHIRTDKLHDENVLQSPGGYALLLPCGEGTDFMTGIVTRILARRPELIQHARLAVGDRIAQTNKRAPKKKAKLVKNRGGPRRRGPNSAPPSG